MKNIATPVKIGWGLVWRATVFFPLSVAFCFLAVGTLFARFAFPFLILLHLYLEDWLLVSILTLGWAISFAVWRSAKFRGLFEEPPSYL